MFDWEFRDPWLLTLALLIPVVYLMWERNPSASVVYSSLTVFDRTPRSLRARFINLPIAMVAIAVLAMIIALAGPRTPDDHTRVRRKGIAIAMIVDRSGSMEARDMVKGKMDINRLQVVKSLFKQFVLGNSSTEHFQGNPIGTGRPDDAISLIAFARYADGLCPLTLDHGNLVNILNDVSIVRQRNEDGTAIGEGLALAVERLRRHPSQSKVAILLTDGVNNMGEISPLQAAGLAAAHNIKVYCIGTGSEGRALFPATDPFTGRQVLRPIQVEIDENTLKKIAQKTGGYYFRATDADSLAEIYTQIDKLERTEITEIHYLQYRQWYSPFVIIAMAMIATSGLLSGTIFRKLP